MHGEDSDTSLQETFTNLHVCACCFCAHWFPASTVHLRSMACSAQMYSDALLLIVTAHFARRVRAASAAQCRAAREASRCWGGGNSSSSSSGGGTASSRGGWDAGDGGDAAEGVASRLQQLQLSYVPAGGWMV
jgi:uncharacterized membrane protein YgcG